MEWPDPASARPASNHLDGMGDDHWHGRGLSGYAVTRLVAPFGFLEWLAFAKKILLQVRNP